MIAEFSGPIIWRIRLGASPERVYQQLATNAGRAAFWARSAVEDASGNIEFVFRSGERWTGTILQRRPPWLFQCTYFGGSVVTFRLQEAATGGTILECTDEGVDASEWLDTHAGWVSVLLTLKASVDHGVDLRNGDGALSWRERFVDV